MKHTNDSFSKITRIVAGSTIALSAFAAIGLPSTSHAYVLTRQLQYGMSGADVSAVQSFLAQDRTLYAEGRVTGYFGPLTRTAVANFQTRNDIPSVGRIGPITLPIINAAMNGGGITYTDAAPLLSNLSVATGMNSVKVSWNANEGVKGVVYYSTAPLTVSELPHSVQISGNAAMTDVQFRTSQNISLSNLESNTTYYYMVHSTDQAGNVSVSMPATFKTTRN
jgi:peptidoglycan hydrolase-like protein with peptidoglycan-binding domain